MTILSVSCTDNSVMNTTETSNTSAYTYIHDTDFSFEDDAAIALADTPVTDEKVTPEEIAETAVENNEDTPELLGFRVPSYLPFYEKSKEELGSLADLVSFAKENQEIAVALQHLATEVTKTVGHLAAIKDKDFYFTNILLPPLVKDLVSISEYSLGRELERSVADLGFVLHD